MEYVYFIREFGSKNIKIGRTTRDDVSERISELQVGNPTELQLISVIDCIDGESELLEKSLHKMFKPYRVPTGGTEWFNDKHGEIKKYILNREKCSMKDLQWFSVNRREQFDYIVDQINREQGIEHNFIIPAPVKSGKREMIEIQALMSGRMEGKFEHILLTSLNRKDTKEQLDELQKYGITIINPAKKKNVKLLNRYSDIINSGKTVIIHLDESDYGTNSCGKLTEFFNIAHPNIQQKNVYWRLYSATNEEAIYSDFLNNSYSMLLPKFEPAETYRGSKWFIDNDLADDSEPFWDEKNACLSQQAHSLCHDFMNSDKLVSVLRLNYNFDNDKSAFMSLLGNGTNKILFKKELEKYNIQLHKVTGNEPFFWGDKKDPTLSEDTKERIQSIVNIEDVSNMYPGRKILIVINDTCTRSTEIKLHKNLYFWHDYRKIKDINDVINKLKNKKGAAYNTILQAAGRVFHYHELGHHIRLFTHVDTLLLDAGYITYDEYIENGTKLSNRIGSKRTELILQENIKEILKNEIIKNKYCSYTDNGYDILFTESQDEADKFCKKYEHKLDLSGLTKDDNGRYMYVFRDKKQVVTIEKLINNPFWGGRDNSNMFRRYPVYDGDKLYYYLINRPDSNDDGLIIETKTTSSLKQN